MSTGTSKSRSGNALDWFLVRRIIGLAAPYRGRLITGTVFTVVVAFLGPVRPYLIQYMLDGPVKNGDERGVLNFTLLLIGLLLFTTVLSFFQSYLMSIVGQSVIRDLRVKVYSFISGAKMRYFDKTPVGTLVTRTVTDIETLADVFSQGFVNIVGDLLQIIVIVVVMFYTDWKLSLISLAVLPVLLFASYIFKEGVKKTFQQVRLQVANLNAFVQEHINGMQIVQIFNRQEPEFEKFKAINKAHQDAHIRSNLYYSIFFPVVEIITALATGLLVWWGMKGIIVGETTFGTIVAFIMYINMFFRPIRQVADRFNTMQMGMVASERVFNLIDDKSLQEAQGAYKPERLSGKVEFRNVSFGYNDDTIILNDINFTLNAGKSLALVGASGAGKSSVINLISGFYPYQQGDILIDDKNLKDYNLMALRKHMAVVIQDVFLFTGSIAHNIRLFDNAMPRQRIIEAAEAIGAHRFIEQLPGGYDFNVMERGNLLSTGQRQLISFIRALAFDPRILILDEATSSVDSETEELIQRAISLLMKGRTTIAVAHRLSTIKNVDEILVMDKGHIVERGNHDELLALNGAYSRLYHIQFEHLEVPG